MPDNNSILEKLNGLVSRYEEVSTLITDPGVIADQQRYVKLTKEYKDLGDIMDARKRYISCLSSIREAKDILANESDPDLKEMAREELQTNEELQPRIEEEIKMALVPKDPEDDKNVQMEIRAGAGGDEAALFAGDLFGMYKRFCDSKGWTLSVTSVSEGAAGGYKEIDFAVSGDGVYGVLKYESGVHRVQRVPATETQGRMHTSAATVAVLPEADKFEVNINVRRPATSPKTRSAPSRACAPSYTTANTRNTSTTSPRAARHWSQPATARQRYAHTTSPRAA